MNYNLTLVVKIGILLVALYLTYLLLKLFAFLLAVAFTVLKVLLPIALVLGMAYVLLRFLFGIDLLRSIDKRVSYHSRHYGIWRKS